MWTFDRWCEPSTKDASTATLRSLWFTGQNGVYGRLDPNTRQIEVFDAPRGRGPYGIATSASGDVYFASLAGSYVGRINLESREVTVLEPPTPNQGARRVWSDSQGTIWVSEWNAGQVAAYDPSTDEWREWKLPGPEFPYTNTINLQILAQRTHLLVNFPNM